MVIAEEWGGYAVAAFLARTGRRVTLLTVPGPSVPNSPVAPSLAAAHLPVVYFGFEKGGLADTFFSELGLSIPALRQDGLYHRPSPPLQVVLPTHRIDLSSDRDELLEEFRREFSTGYSSIQGLLSHLDELESEIYSALGQISSLEPSGLRDRMVLFRERVRKNRLIKRYASQSALTFLRQSITDPSWEAFFNLLSLFVYQKPVEDSTLLHLLLLHGGLRRGPVCWIQGQDSVKKRLTDVLTKNRGEVFPAQSVGQIRRAAKGIAELRVDDRVTVRADQFVVALPRLNLGEPVPTPYALWSQYEVSEDVIPDPMADQLALSWEKGESPVQHNMIALRLIRNGGEEGSVKRRFQLISQVLLAESEAEQGRLGSIEEATEKRIRWLLPFSEEKLCRVTSSVIPSCRPLESLLEPSLYRNLRPVRVGSSVYYRFRKSDAFVVLPTLRTGNVGDLPFVKSLFHWVKSRE